MSYVLKEMGEKVPEGFFRFDIFLAANVAIFAMQLCIAIKAISFFAFIKMTQRVVILLKIIKFNCLKSRGIIYDRETYSKFEHEIDNNDKTGFCFFADNNNFN